MVKRSKFQTGKLVGWQYIILGLFSLVALSAGIPKLFALEAMVTNMARLGYGQALTQVLGLFWVAAAVGVWLARYRIWAALGSLFIVAGAIATHYAVGDGFIFAILPHLVLALAILHFSGFFKKLSN